MGSIKKVKHWYIDSFKELLDFYKEPLVQDLNKQFGSIKYPAHKKEDKPQNKKSFYVEMEDGKVTQNLMEKNNKLVGLIKHIKKRHDPVVTTMAQGIIEFKEKNQTNILALEIQDFLDRFYLSRIGIRMLLGQHISMHLDKKRENYVGVICTKTKPSKIIKEAVNDAMFICENYYGLFKAPEIKVYCEDKIEFQYVPSHLHHMVFELVKNSLRAVIERFGDDYEKDYPIINIVVSEGREDITIKVSDEGGGIPRSGMPLVWTYMYTTAQAPSLDPDFNQTDFRAPMAGFGYGLPISRLYARYFGGDLKLISMEKYGTDAYLHLNRLSDSEEPLP